jgi:hypothetical protein
MPLQGVDRKPSLMNHGAIASQPPEQSPRWSGPRRWFGHGSTSPIQRDPERLGRRSGAMHLFLWEVFEAPNGSRTG